MKKIIFVISLSMISLTSSGNENNSVNYNNFEINQQLNQIELEQLSTTYLRAYFSNKQPNTVVDNLLQADLTPLQAEYILFNLLTEISQQPPQASYQNFVDRMKTYPVQATRTADEGHVPMNIFNLNSKAYGIENIWTAYQTEQHFNLLLNDDIPQAISKIKTILAQKITLRRPQWLGVKNSIAALSDNTLHKLTNHLSSTVKINTGLDTLISHVGLFTGDIELIEKALLSDQTQVRELTLRQAASHLPLPLSKPLLLKNADSGLDRKFSTSLLRQYNQDSDVELFLIDQLNDKLTAGNAAFVLSQSDSLNLPALLKKKYLSSNNNNEKNHILLTLKLNQSSSAQLVVNDLQPFIEKDSPAAQWIKSFETEASGEQQ